MDLNDNSFPVRAVNTFDNAAYQKERREARKRHMQDLEDAFAAATTLREEKEQEPMNANSSVHRRFNDGLFRSSAHSRASLGSNSPSSSAHRKLGVGSLMADDQEGPNLAPHAMIQEVDEHDDNTRLVIPHHDKFLDDMDLHDQSPPSKKKRLCGCSSVFFSMVGCFALLMEFGIACWGGRTRCQKRTFLACCVAFSLFAIVVSVFAVAVVDTENNRISDGVYLPSLDADWEPKSMHRYNAIRDVIVQYATTNETLLDDMNSPCSLALRWVTDYDAARLHPSSKVLVQRYALAVLYFATQEVVVDDAKTVIVNTTKWTNSTHWLSQHGVCNWHGVACPAIQHDELLHVQYNADVPIVGLNLTNNNLGGTIPQELQGLRDSLKLLDLTNNELTGNIVTSLGELQDLTTLHLRENKLTGTFPVDLTNLTELSSFHLGDNELNGDIPTQLSKLKKLESLGLDHNDFSGPLPDFRTLVDLRVLRLESNRFIGTILGHLEKMVNLQDLRLSKNHLVGSIPASILKVPHLEYMYLSHNRLEGTIPDWFHSAMRLKEIQLNNNKLSGGLPTTLGTLDLLRVLYLNDNRFTGSIPRQYGNLDDLEEFYLFDNKLSGTIPTSIGNMINLKELRIYRTQISGSIPKEIGHATHLQVMSLHHNFLNGTVPENIGQLQDLRAFRFFSNQITGEVPGEVCDLRSHGELTFLASDCNLDMGGTVDCGCCHECYPQENRKA